MTKAVARWLDGELRFPDVGAGGWDSIRVRRVADWAREHGVRLDPLYATYDREGGTLALFDDLPAVPREQLMVYGQAEWEQARGTLAHEAWVAKVMRELTAR